jgi:hypothetical protein
MPIKPTPPEEGDGKLRFFIRIKMAELPKGKAFTEFGFFDFNKKVQVG